MKKADSGVIKFPFCEGKFISANQICYEKLVDIYTKRGDKELADVFKELVEMEKRKVF